MRRHSFTSNSARRALGAAGIVGFVVLALCSESNVLTRFHIMNAAKAEDGLIGAFHPRAGSSSRGEPMTDATLPPPAPTMRYSGVG
jgi:hypothetical protein